MKINKKRINILSGKGGYKSNITDNIEEAVLNKDLVWVTTPAHCFPKIASMISPYVKRRTVYRDSTRKWRSRICLS